MTIHYDVYAMCLPLNTTLLHTVQPLACLASNTHGDEHSSIIYVFLLISVN